MKDLGAFFGPIFVMCRRASFFVKQSKSKEPMIYTIFRFFKIHIPKIDSFPMLFSHPAWPPVCPAALKLVRVPVFLSSQVIKLVRVPVFLSSQVIKLVRFPVFLSFQVIKMVPVPVFLSSQVIKLGRFPVFLSSQAIKMFRFPTFSKSQLIPTGFPNKIQLFQ